ncbi:hypothetical protein Tco_0799599 [Tanacetum coccineum]|uniref:RNA-directed DNA polymerase, eukaryota n=1 Tax=Tanacetum coccineum TaxID=301880 RepID=A0ABQ4ZTM1_9ASTR
MFNGIKLSSSLSISHLFYANDAVFMGQWCDGNISTLIHVLKCFYRASGLRINMSKSKILGVNVDSDKVKGAASKLGCIILKTPFTYLGSKVGGSMSRVHAWNEVIDRVKNRLSKWKMKTLSIGGNHAVENLSLDSCKFDHGGVRNLRSLFGFILFEELRGVGCAGSIQRGVSLVHDVSLIPCMKLDMGLGELGRFSVASVFRKIIDVIRFRMLTLKTRWIKMCDKGEVSCLDVKTDSISRRGLMFHARGIDIDSIMCVICDNGVETSRHLFFYCCMVRQIVRKITRW